MKSHHGSRIILMLSLASFLSLSAMGIAATAESAPAPSGAAPQTIKGHIQNIEGEVYSIKDVSGHEVQLRVTKETKVEGGLKPKVGDRIEAQVAADGQAISVALMIPDAAPTPPAAARPPAAPSTPVPATP